MPANKIDLTEAAQAVFDKALVSNEPKHVQAAVRAIYRAARDVVENRGAYRDPVVLAFLIELASRLRALEERVGFSLEPPTRG